MKTNKPSIVLFLSTIILTSGVLGQSGNLDLYLNPDVHSKLIETVAPGDARLGQATPVLDDAKAALGWQFADFNGKVEGYVPDAKIGKDMLPVDNTIIRSGPSTDSTVLGVYNFGDPIEIMDTGLWWKIVVETTFPVYFIEESLPPATLVQNAPTIDSAPATTINTDGAILDDTTVFTNTSVEPATGGGVPPVSIIERQREPRIGIVARNYTGVLEKSKSRPLFKPKAPYYLVGQNGKRMLWVNFAEVIMPGTIDNFVGREVFVHGEPTQDEKSKDWILHVRTIRENR